MSDSTTENRQGTTVRLCRVCSTIDGKPPVGDSCLGVHEWIDVPLVDDSAGHSHVVMPHPDGGWPEVHITRIYIVHSDDPAVVETERARLLHEALDS